ncbi:MAG: AarF/ABC1/UbiB kinase family protein [Verrucomicrobiae bacterium]|nr:AarF/ABC1/UbiB kinase family protein [Verrucomicrobiae bacterium]
MTFSRFRKLGRTLQHAQRFRQIVSVFLKYGFHDLTTKIGLPRVRRIPFLQDREEQSAISAMSQPERLRRACEELGPTFVKLGQLFASRTQLLPKEFTDELSKLQDEVEPISFDQLAAVIEKELDAPVATIFQTIERKPLGAASIAQVHQAVLRTGEPVVVKVQRPGIAQNAALDLEIMQQIARMAERHLEGWAIHRPTGVVDELARSLEKELDFSREAAHLERFAWQFEEDETIYIPKVYYAASTGRVLTMEFIDAIKVSSLEKLAAAQLDRKEIAVRIADLVMKQIFEHGFFHADPHPGNIHILPGNRICFLDFGLMGFLDNRTRETFVDLVWGIARRNEVSVTNALLKLAEPGSEGEPSREGLESDIADFMHQHFYRPVGELKFGKLVTELFELTAKNRLRLPPDLFIMLKALSLTEELVRHLNPAHNLVEQAEPFMRKARMARLRPERFAGSVLEFGRDFSDLARDLPAELRRIISQIKTGDARINFQHRGLEPAIISAERVSNRISYSLVLASLIIGSALIVHAKLDLAEIPILGLIGFILSALMAFGLLISIVRHGRM